MKNSKPVILILFICTLLYVQTGCQVDSINKQHNSEIFKTFEKQRQYIDLYNKNLKLWPVNYSEKYVKTKFGETYVLTCGKQDAPPLILLHSMSSSSIQWYVNVSELSKHYRVYTIDRIGDLGKSIAKIHPANLDDLSEWLSEVMDSLSLKKVDMIGHSYGGWITMGFAIRKPKRINKIVLLSPGSSILETEGKFMWLGFKASYFPRTNKSIKKFQDYICLNDTIVSKQMKVGFKNWTPPKETAKPTVFTDQELRKLNCPVLFLMGENDVIYNANDAIIRADSCILNCNTELIPNAGHNVIIEQPNIVNGIILKFLSDSNTRETL
jgi:pimeloyl-ACP methyl ester carboxylesterase